MTTPDHQPDKSEDGPVAISSSNLPDFYPELKQKLTFPLAFTSCDPEQWRRKTRATAADLMLPDGAAGLPGGTASDVPFAPALHDSVDRGDFLAQRVAFNVTAESRITALVLVPKGEGPFPAALLLHDHGSRFDIGKEKGIRPWYDDARLAASHDWSDRYFSGLFPGEELARRGYVVVAIDALGWGDRIGNGYEAQQALACNLFNLGSSLAGLVAAEDIRSARFVRMLPKVDPDRLVAVGFSFGAFRAWQLAALSDDVKAAVAVCWMATINGLMVPGNNQLRGQSAWYMTHPGLAKCLDYPDVAALAAPKPLYFMSGEDDPLFPRQAVQQAYERMQRVWSAFGKSENLRTELWPGGHGFTRDRQQAAFDWLAGCF
ncbi:dienelactone hydrolase family protein [Cohaesibacter haloalkalitolerans]|uniref:dienelactone hydrolase family protein n=1 Tax=Cohaesibacter haloalkalitolerans TaxID=1162980 RepID=UPI000E65AAD5|nr:alpha/beta fold hydrolase [Cohaesibacter haloalkalitolerans]